MLETGPFEPLPSSSRWTPQVRQTPKSDPSPGFILCYQRCCFIFLLAPTLPFSFRTRSAVNRFLYSLSMLIECLFALASSETPFFGAPLVRLYCPFPWLPSSCSHCCHVPNSSVLCFTHWRKALLSLQTFTSALSPLSTSKATSGRHPYLEFEDLPVHSLVTPLILQALC